MDCVRKSMAVAAGLCFLLSGCGSEKTAYPLVSVTGSVKYADGSLIPAKRITLKFVSQQSPVDAKTHPRPGLGEVNVEDGSFIVSTYNYNDGVIRGKHKVTVQSLDEKNHATDAIPKRYGDSNSSPLEVDTQNMPFDLVIEKP